MLYIHESFTHPGEVIDSATLAKRTAANGPVSISVHATGRYDIDLLKAALKAAGIENKKVVLNIGDMFG